MSDTTIAITENRHRRAMMLDTATRGHLATIETRLLFLSTAIRGMADKGITAPDAFGLAGYVADLALELNEMIGDDQPAKGGA